MPSTYTNNLGIQKPANGEQSGTWGETVNINSDILDNAINGVLALTLSGTSSTLTTANGVASNGQYKVLVLGGSPSGTHTITIDPNTAQKLYFVNNLTAQSVVITQGSGGSVTLVTNSSAVIYADGAGAAAKVTNLTNSLAMSATKITGGSITGITDLAIADGGTGSSTAAGALTNFGLTATAAEINKLDGMTATTAELNILDGVTATTAEINKLDGLTATTAELNILDGVTATTAELNILDGVTATTAELNFVDGVTSNVQTQINAKANLSSPALTGTPTAPTASAATDTTQIATTAYVRDAIPNVFNATGSAPLYACRAWVNFNGNVSGATIASSRNVSSTQRLSVGSYRINYTTSMPAGNYAAVAANQRVGDYTEQVNLSSLSAGYMTFTTRAYDGGISDSEDICIAVFA